MFGLPFVYGDRGEVLGQGFAAEVSLRGTALAATEGPGAYWLYGVQPGSVSGSGGSPEEAMSRFRARLWDTVDEIARASSDLSELRRALVFSLDLKNSSLEEHWLRSVEPGPAPADSGGRGVPASSKAARAEVTVLALPGTRSAAGPASRRAEHWVIEIVREAPR
jgi:hypothetical protein